MPPDWPVITSGDGCLDTDVNTQRAANAVCSPVYQVSSVKAQRAGYPSDAYSLQLTWCAR